MRATHLLPALLLHQLLLLPTAIPAAGQFFYHFPSDPRPPRSRSTSPLPRSGGTGGRWEGAARRSQPAGRSPEPTARRWGWQSPRSPAQRSAAQPVPAGPGALRPRCPRDALPPRRSRSAERGAGLARDGQTCTQGERGRKSHHCSTRGAAGPLSGRDRVSLISSGRMNVK